MASFRLFSTNPILLAFLFTLFLKSSLAEIKRYQLADLESVAIWNLNSSSCSSSKLPHGPSLHMVYGYGPCAPYKEKLTFHKFFYEDQLRVDAIRKLATNIPTEMYGTTGALISIEIGTPPTRVNLLIDTGSSLTWVRCKPREPMNPELTRINYDRRESHTYQNVSYESNSCRALHASSNDGGNCQYRVLYGSPSISTGLLGQETLVIGTDILTEHKFGCSRLERGSLTAAKYDGILGADRGYDSFLSQTRNKYGGVFSYCMPANPRSTGSIYFGGYRSSPSEVRYTQMITGQVPFHYFYYINLVGISVAGRMLDILPSEFDHTIIDTGTAISRLSTDAYSTLRNNFVREMDSLGFPPPESRGTLFDTCYEIPRLPVSIPTINLHFGGGATIPAAPAGILVDTDKPHIYCLAFAPGNVRVLGYRQQTAIEVIYDIPNSRIGFGKC